MTNGDRVRSVQVPISLSAEQYQQYYQGAARNVFARDLEGRTVQFPASALQRFVTRDGVHGLFEIRFDAQGKLREVLKIGQTC